MGVLPYLGTMDLYIFWHCIKKGQQILFYFPLLFTEYTIRQLSVGKTYNFFKCFEGLLRNFFLSSWVILKIVDCIIGSYF